MYLLNFIKKIAKERELLVIAKEIKLKLSTYRWNKKHEIFNNFFLKKDWEKAIEGAEISLLRQDVDEVFLRKLAYCYWVNRDYLKAEYYMKKSLNMRFKGKVFRHSNYFYLGGQSNLGFIKHKGKYLTKIISNNYPMDHYANKEIYFHFVICKKYPRLNNISVDTLKYRKNLYGDIALITFKKINKSPINKKNLYNIINISKYISSSIKYKDVMEILKTTDKAKANPLPFLANKLSTHERVLKNMEKKSKSLENHIIDNVLFKLRKNIIGLKLYKNISPEKDYVFIHGDFEEGNVIYSKEDDRYYVIDWSSYGLGLHGYDIAMFLARYNLSFKEIKDNYIEEIFASTQKSILHKVFFAYNLIIIWIDRLALKDEEVFTIDQKIKQCILPALEYMEKLVLEL